MLVVGRGRWTERPHAGKSEKCPRTFVVEFAEICLAAGRLHDLTRRVGNCRVKRLGMLRESQMSVSPRVFRAKLFLP